MPERLLKTQSTVFSNQKLTDYVNASKGTNFGNIATAATGLGGTVAGIVTKNPIALGISAALGLGLGMATVVSAVEEALDPGSLTNTYRRMSASNKLKVTTNFYEWSSMNGNSYTYYSKNTYTIV